jgi:hypothetical protein
VLRVGLSEIEVDSGFQHRGHRGRTTEVTEKKNKIRGAKRKTFARSSVWAEYERVGSLCEAVARLQRRERENGRIVTALDLVGSG